MVFPLLVEFASGTTLYREPELVSQLPILRNGPAGTFVVFPDGLRVSLPTDQIVWADDQDGRARVGFGGMYFTGIEGGRLTFLRVRELRPEAHLSPDRSRVMTLAPSWVSTILMDGDMVWPTESAVSSPPAGRT